MSEWYFGRNRNEKEDAISYTFSANEYQDSWTT